MMLDVIRSEWLKVRSTRATVWTLPLMFVLSTALTVLISTSGRNSESMTEHWGDLDTRFATLLGLNMGQLLLIVFGVMAIGSEYSTGSIRSSLAAVPRRGRFFMGKVLATGLLAALVSAISVVVAFFAARAALGPYGVSITEAEMPQALLGAWLYLTMICLFALGLTAVLRSSVAAMAILLPLLFLESQGLGNFNAIKEFAQYLPAEAGMSAMRLAPVGDQSFGKDYGPWTGLGIVALWTAAALIAGYVATRRREA